MSEAPLTELAKAFAAKTAHPASSWERVLQEHKVAIRNARLSREDLIALAEALEAPSELAKFLPLLTRAPGRHPEHPHPLKDLRERMSDFSFSFAAWLRSMRKVQEEAEENGASGSFDSYLEFVSCCAEYASRQAFRADLVATTDDLLNEFGYTGESTHENPSVS